MEETVLIYIQNDTLDQFDLEDSHVVKWIKRDKEGAPITRGAQAHLEQVSSVTQNANVVVLLPLEQILLTHVNTHARKQKHLQKTVPYALEDELADDVDNLHFALGQRHGENDFPVAVIAKQMLDKVLNELASAEIYPKILTADVFGLPLEENTWTVLIEEKRALIRTGKYQGFTIDLHNLQQMLTSSLDQSEVAPEKINLYRCDKQQEEVKDLDLPVEVHEISGSPPGLFVDGLDEKECINLLQNTYKKKDIRYRHASAWRIAAMLFAAWITLSFASVFLDHLRLRKQEQKLDDQIVEIMKQTFPDAQNISADNARTKMEARLKNFINTTNEEAQAGFMELVATSGESIKQAGEVDIDIMNYQKGTLNMHVKSPDVQILDAVKQDLSNRNYKVDIQSANTQGDSVEAKLIIAKENLQ